MNNNTNNDLNNQNNILNNQPINNNEVNNSNINVQDNNVVNPVQHPEQTMQPIMEQTAQNINETNNQNNIQMNNLNNHFVNQTGQSEQVVAPTINQIPQNMIDPNMTNQNIQSTNQFENQAVQTEQIVTPTINQISQNMIDPNVINQNNNLAIDNQPLNNGNVGNNNQFINQTGQQEQVVAPTINQIPQNMIDPNMINQNNMQMNNQNINPGMPNLGAQPTDANNNKKNDKLKFILIGVCVALVVAVIGGINFYQNSKEVNDDNKTVNEYEEDNNKNEDQDDDVDVNTTTNSNSISYNGFKFNKVSGYEYEEDNGTLIVNDKDTAVLINVTKVSFDNVKMNYNQLSTILSQQGFTTGAAKISDYDGKEVITCEISDGEINYIYYLISSPDEDFIYEGLVFNSSSFINYSDINEMINITSDSSYVGDYNDFATEFGLDLNKNSFEF